MTIEYTPVDVACNLKCAYCYQTPMRDGGNASSPSNWNKAREELSRQNYEFTVFGGEPLLAPMEHLEEVFQFGYERFGRNGIQTNGVLLTQGHIDLFRKYNVGVGVSCDGPGALSDLRGPRATTDATLSAIEKLCSAYLFPSIIVTVHKLNTSITARAELFRWFSHLQRLGVQSINLHMLELECGMEHLALTERENTEAFKSLYTYARTSPIDFQPFLDIHRLLTGFDANKANCIWQACDPLTTPAVSGVSRDGTKRNCGRVNKDGVNWVKSDTGGSERYLVLHQTPIEHGGCKDCDYFVFCKGNCPGTAIDGDWRNRSVHCKTWYSIFELTERDIILSGGLPISRQPERLQEMTNRFIAKCGGKVKVVAKWI